jgi:hypothetical protein
VAIRFLPTHLVKASVVLRKGKLKVRFSLSRNVPETLRVKILGKIYTRGESVEITLSDAKGIAVHIQQNMQGKWKHIGVSDYFVEVDGTWR